LEGDAQLLGKLPERAFLQVLAVVQPSTRQCHLAGVPAHVERTLEDREHRLLAVQQDHERHRGGSLRKLGLAALEAPEGLLYGLPNHRHPSPSAGARRSSAVPPLISAAILGSTSPMGGFPQYCSTVI